MTEVEKNAETKHNLNLQYVKQPQIQVKNLSVFTPRGEKLLEKINEEFVRGHSYLIKGDSGIGKSTFVRTIAGIWPFAEGDILLPSNQQTMFIPQKPYMPIGTLKDALVFPNNIQLYSEEKLIELLKWVGLDQLIDQLDVSSMWGQQLSPGEQQRIAFIRVLLHEPRWVFLDESTSALDMDRERGIYKLLKDHLPYCTLVSVGHRPSLDEYHDKIINIEKYCV